jgi:hypothetical protein
MSRSSHYIAIMTQTERSARYANPLSILGVVLTTFSAGLFLTFFFLDIAGFETNPYLGILTFLLLPAVFGAGLLLIPFGIWRERRRVAAGYTARRLAWPVIDLNHATVRRTAFVFAVLTCVNIVLVATASFKAVEYAESRQFCTGTCHTPMEPQSIANRSTLHAAVSCAACHIGPGAPGFARAKWGGIRQLAGVVMNSHPRPVPSPVHNLPSAFGTCTRCHARDAYVGEIVQQIKTYADDETSTESVTTLTLHVGGGDTPSPQIHWHASSTTQIEYIATDAKRETIPWVRVTDRTGNVREYVVDDVSAEALAQGERRTMDCTDCHNRQGHAMAASAESAIDRALEKGLLAATLPFVRRETVAAIRDDTRDAARAEKEIADRLGAFYAQTYPNLAGDARVAQTIAAAQQIYGSNIFPAMKVGWGTYPSQLGHTEATGCFRCHDDLHKAAGGLVISQDCEKCHRMQ